MSTASRIASPDCRARAARRRLSFAVVATLLASVLALAGCADDPKPLDSTDTTGDTTGGSDTTTGDTSGGDTGGDTGTSPDTSADTAQDTTAPPPPDADNDGISDDDEGTGDSDGDGTPDRMDSDSDNDGIPDSVEAGDADTRTPPVDSDGDDTPDFRDDDSDANGIPDAVELDGDVDGDGIADFRDSDNDEDFVQDAVEIAGGPGDCDGDGAADPDGDPTLPWDCDGDATHDYNDLDSDADTIADRYEGASRDGDADGFLDRYDQDSDGDGIPDSVEAGDADLDTVPVDSDGDQTPDYRDRDSDNDGLADDAEVAAGTNPAVGDSDMDGVSDLVEVAAGTDPNSSADNPAVRGDFVFLVPYEQPTDPMRDTLEFRTSIQFADLYFLFDTTGSMLEELNAMASQTTGVPAIIAQLQCQPTGGACTVDADCASGICFNGSCIQDPLVGAGCVPDLWTGTGEFWHINSYNNLLSVQPSATVTADNIPDSSSQGYSQGFAEAPQWVPYCVADETHCGSGCATTGIGCPGFREQAISILVEITDADDQCSTSHGNCSAYSATGAGQILRDFNPGHPIRFIGLYGDDDDASGGYTPQSLLTEIANAARITTTEPIFVYQAIDSSVVTSTVQAVRDIVRSVTIRATIAAADDPADAVDATQFIDHLEVNVSGQGNCTATLNGVPLATEDTNLDTFHDAFGAIIPGTPVCFDVVPIPSNTTVPATEQPQLYRATVTVFGDGSPLDQRDVYFLIPPVIFNEPN